MMRPSRWVWGIAVVGLALLSPAGRVFGAEAKKEDWSGALKVGQVSLRLVFHVKECARGYALGDFGQSRSRSE